MSIIQATQLSKVFRRFSLSGTQQTVAVNNLSLSIQKGEIFAFLGPNGAGKTTTISMLVGCLVPTKGTIKLFETDFKYNDRVLKRRIGYLPETPGLPDYYHVQEFMDFYCDIFLIPRKKRKGIIAALLERVGIEEQRKEIIRDLSMGQKRCLGLAAALINDPEIIFLDEPTVYLDPLIVEKVREILIALKREGKTVFMSSHTLSEVEKVSDRFAIIKHGTFIEQGLTQEIAKARSLEEEFLRMMKSHE